MLQRYFLSIAFSRSVADIALRTIMHTHRSFVVRHNISVLAKEYTKRIRINHYASERIANSFDQESITLQSCQRQLERWNVLSEYVSRISDCIVALKDMQVLNSELPDGMQVDPAANEGLQTARERLNIDLPAVSDIIAAFTPTNDQVVNNLHARLVTLTSDIAGISRELQEYLNSTPETAAPLQGIITQFRTLRMQWYHYKHDAKTHEYALIRAIEKYQQQLREHQEESQELKRAATKMLKDYKDRPPRTPLGIALNGCTAIASNVAIFVVLQCTIDTLPNEMLLSAYVSTEMMISLMGNIGVEVLGFAAYERVADTDKKMQKQAWWIQAMYLTIETLPYALGIAACYNQSDYSKLLALGGCAITVAFYETALANSEKGIIAAVKDTLNHLPAIRGYTGNLMSTPQSFSVEIG